VHEPVERLALQAILQRKLKSRKSLWQKFQQLRRSQTVTEGFVKSLLAAV
jgi:hypothetical protein